MPRCYIVDIDGTIADASHRQHLVTVSAHNKKKDFDRFYDLAGGDQPFSHIRQLLYHLVDHTHCNVCIVYVSGRVERIRALTKQWIIINSFPWHGHLYMRPDGDYRPDDVLKEELLQRLLADGFDPIMAFDDRDRVVEMWRRNGVPCAQVARGNF